jgi:hypothetical protein
MFFGTTTVSDDAIHPDPSVETHITLHCGGKTSGHAVNVGNENNRNSEPSGNLCRAAFQTVHLSPVKQTHDTLDHNYVGVRGDAGEESFHVFASHHPTVEVIAGSSRSEGKVRWIEEIRTDLERLDPISPAPERGHEGKGKRVFPTPLCVPPMASLGQGLLTLQLPSAPSTGLQSVFDFPHLRHRVCQFDQTAGGVSPVKTLMVPGWHF